MCMYSEYQFYLWTLSVYWSMQLMEYHLHLDPYSRM